MEYSNKSCEHWIWFWVLWQGSEKHQGKKKVRFAKEVTEFQLENKGQHLHHHGNSRKPEMEVLLMESGPKLEDIMPPNRAVLYRGIMNYRKGPLRFWKVAKCSALFVFILFCLPFEIIIQKNNLIHLKLDFINPIVDKLNFIFFNFKQELVITFFFSFYFFLIVLW